MTCNPDPDSWVKDFIKFWLDDEGEYADPNKSGVIRWMLRGDDDELIWFDSKKLAQEFSDDMGESEQKAKSVTFISSSVYDNKILLEKDPGYLVNLMALPRVERERLLHGNWKIQSHKGDIFSIDDFEIVDSVPIPEQECRCFDRAATEPNKDNKDPDWTCGVRMQRNGDLFFITDVQKFRVGPGKVETRIKNIVSRDGKECAVILIIDPGQAGKVEIHHYYGLLAGYSIETIRETKKKSLKWLPFSAQAQIGNVKLLRAPWNDAFLNELSNLSEDPKEYNHDDQADAASGAFENLTSGTRMRFV